MAALEDDVAALRREVKNLRQEVAHLKSAQAPSSHRAPAPQGLEAATRLPVFEPTWVACVQCGAFFYADRPRTQTCSAACAHARAVRIPRASRPCIDCGGPTLRRGHAKRCLPCAEEQHRALARAYQRAHRPAPRERVPREPMVRIAGTFLKEDLAQERALAELEGRAFDKRDFYQRHAPYQERAILDRPVREEGCTLHDLVPDSGEWLRRQSAGGAVSHAEARMVERLDCGPLTAEGGDPAPAALHALTLDEAEPAIGAWLAFIARMTPDEYHESNLRAQIEALVPGMAMGEVLRICGAALGWSERDVERRAGLPPGSFCALGRGTLARRATQALAGVLSAVRGLPAGVLRAHLAAAWGEAPRGRTQPARVERRPLTLTLGERLEARR